MKRTSRTLVPALLLLALAACQTTGGGSADPAAAPAPRLQAILDSGELRVGLTGSQPPLNMTDGTGRMVGLEVDIVRALAESMELEIRFVRKPFAELLPALEAAEVDLVVSGLTITPRRNARVAFAGPYFVSGKSVLTRAGHIESAETPADLDAPGRRYAALAGSTSQRFVQKMLPNSALAAVSDHPEGVRMVLEGEVDGLVADYPAAAWSAARDPGLRALTTPFTMEPLGIALPPGDPLFLNLVENHLTSLRETGLLLLFKARWLSGDPAALEGL